MSFITETLSRRGKNFRLLYETPQLIVNSAPGCVLAISCHKQFVFTRINNVTSGVDAEAPRGPRKAGGDETGRKSSSALFSRILLLLLMKGGGGSGGCRVLLSQRNKTLRAVMTDFSTGGKTLKWPQTVQHRPNR